MTDRTTSSSPQTGSQDNIDEQAIEWFVRMRADNVTESERQRFEEWLAVTEHRRAYQGVTGLWGENELSLAVKKTAERMESDEDRNEATSRRRLRPVFAAAATVCLVVLLKFALPPIGIYLQQDFSTASGQQQTIELADGSLLTLNTDSAVAVDYSTGQRRIRLLKGEAVFDVQPNKQRPFVVEAGSVTARAVGTRYRVYRSDKQVNVDVLEGIVEVNAESQNSLQIEHNEQVQVRPNDTGLLTPLASNPADSAWLQGRLVFNNARLSVVLYEIGRYHSGLLTLANPKIREIRVSGSFSLADTSAILETLEQTLPISIIHLPEVATLVY